MGDPPAARRNPTRTADGGVAPAATWVRRHLRLVLGVAAVVVVVIVAAVALAVRGSSGGGAAVAPGSIVGNGPLTTGYRLSGRVEARTATTVTVVISRVDASAGEARNVVLRAGAAIEFEKPADGSVALARNGHQIASTAQLHVGDSLVLVGQFTTAAGPAPHQGYCYIGIEASS